MYEALLNLFNWIKLELIEPVIKALTNSEVINTIIDKLNHLINRLLGLFNGNFEEYSYLDLSLVGEVVGMIVLIIALLMLIKMIKCIVQSISSWISGDTIIITNVRERRKRKNKRG